MSPGAGYAHQMPERWYELVGKHVLVGLTYLDNDGSLIEQKQRHGVIVSADDEGVCVRVAESEEELWLPPDLESFQEADEGDYRLRETGEVVSDPDLLVSYTITPESGT
jgi:hypothetical protein